MHPPCAGECALRRIESVIFRNEARVDLLTTLRKEEEEKDLQTSRDRPQTHHPTPSAMYVEKTSPDAVCYHLSQCNHHDTGGTLLCKRSHKKRQTNFKTTILPRRRVGDNSWMYRGAMHAARPTPMPMRNLPPIYMMIKILSSNILW